MNIKFQALILTRFETLSKVRNFEITKSHACENLIGFDKENEELNWVPVAGKR